MTQNKKMASLLLGVGVLTTAALAAQKTDETQAATRKVTYTEGATTVWTSPTTGQTVKRYLTPNQTVEFVSAKQVGGTKWLETTDGGWVPETYLSGEIAGSASTSNSTSTSNPGANTATAAGSLTVTYAGGATTIWQSASFSQVKTYLVKGQTVSYVASRTANGGTWYQLANGGWVYGAYVSAGGASTTAPSTPSAPNTSNTTNNSNNAATPAGTLTVTYSGGATTVWQNAGFGGVKGYLTKGQQVKYLSAKTANGGTWYQLANGGWVLSAYVSTGGATTNTNNTNNSSSTTNTNNNSGNTSSTTARASRAQIVSYAKNFLGVPYVWGGTSPAGFDCSGLVQYVYAHFGIKLSRVTYAQEYNGPIKAASAAQAGDLLFFGSRGSTYHVAISLGNGQYIHAPQPGQTVTIGSTQWFAPSFAMSVPGVY
ncbi:C40 family peptidase [Lapidilactobacillus luobeiensis]|uniref:C40 family peptidase n=1 Tax=Lapidilactobacillus luobeiensis TaxID=2950371 RepID=UPI0021C2CDE3|nr:NlpC/P60 family protein [Lapidilactobacillus luobeiensis]